MEKRILVMRRAFLLLALLLSVSAPALAIVAWPQPATASTERNWWVVRAYFEERSMVDELAAWKAPWEVNYEEGYLVVGVSRAERRRLLDAGFRLEVDEVLTEELSQPRVASPGQVSGIPGYACYRTVEETYATAQQIATAHPTLASWIDIGDSWQKSQAPNDGYDLGVLRLTNAEMPGPKPKIMIVSSIHAREYAPAELNTRFAEYMVENYGVDADVTWLLDYHELHLQLQGNPDGRKFAEMGQLWRKNVDDVDGCLDNDPYDASDLRTHGVDLNRNFSFEWGNWGGSSPNACDETYRGSAPTSEPETEAIQNYLRAEFPDQRVDALEAAAPITATGVFIDLHSYGELMLWPWGFNLTPGNAAGLQTMGRKLAYFNSYEPQQASELYPTDGTTDDFAYGELGLAAFTFELGTRTFFQNCSPFANTILPENLPALLYAAKVARTPYLTPAGPDALDVAVSPTGASSGTAISLTATVDDSRYRDPSRGASEPTQDIAAAAYYVDVPPWITGTISHTLSAVDGAFDEVREEVVASVDTSQLEDGRHILFVHARDEDGNWGAVSAVFVEIGEVSAGFVAHPTVVAPGETVVFTNTSTGSDLSYEWDFGDGSPVSHEETPEHVFAEPGTYTVTLTASNAIGQDRHAMDLRVATRHYFPFHSRAP